MTVLINQKIFQIIQCYKDHQTDLLTTIDLLDQFLQKNTLLSNTISSGIYYKILSNKSSSESSKLIYENINEEYKLTYEEINKLIELLDEPLYVHILESSWVCENTKHIIEYAKYKQYFSQYMIEFYDYLMGDCDKGYYDFVILLEKITTILQRNYIFKKQSGTYSVLTDIFCHVSLEHFSHELINNLYKKYMLLNITAKKSLMQQFFTVNYYKSESVSQALINFSQYGLDLNWNVKSYIKISKNKNEMQFVLHDNIAAFELLDNIFGVVKILANESFNILTTNSRGENILHLLQASIHCDKEVMSSLNISMGKLNEQNRQYLFFQYDINNETPLMKAVREHNTIMVDFIMSWSVNPWDSCEGIEENYKSALNYLSLLLELKTDDPTYGIYTFGSQPNFMGSAFALKRDVWFNWQKNWSKKKLYMKLDNSLPNKNEDMKKVKI